MFLFRSMYILYGSATRKIRYHIVKLVCQEFNKIFSFEAYCDNKLKTHLVALKLDENQESFPPKIFLRFKLGCKAFSYIISYYKKVLQ